MIWIIVQSFSFPYEAQIAKTQLEAAEIPARIENEHTINMDWLYSNALGGVRLLVLEIYAFVDRLYCGGICWANRIIRLMVFMVD